MTKIINLEKEKLFDLATEGAITKVIHHLEEEFQQYGYDWAHEIAVLIEAEDLMLNHYYELKVMT